MGRAARLRRQQAQQGQDDSPLILTPAPPTETPQESAPVGDMTCRMMVRDDLPVPDKVVRMAERESLYELAMQIGIDTTTAAINDFLTDEERGNYALIHHLWRISTNVRIRESEKHSGGSAKLSIERSQVHVGRTWQPAQSVLVVYPDGAVESTGVLRWQGMAQIGGDERFPVVAFEGYAVNDEDGRESPAMLIYDPLVVIITTQGERLYQPGVVSLPLPDHFLAFLHQRKDWPPTNEWVGKAVTKSAENAKAIEGALRENGLVVPEDAATRQQVLEQRVTDMLNMAERTGPVGTPTQSRMHITPVRSADKTEEAEIVLWLRAWRQRVKAWQEAAMGESGGDMSTTEVWSLQPEYITRDEQGTRMGIDFDPPHTLEVLYPSGRVIEVAAERFGGLVRLSNVERDLGVLVVAAEDDGHAMFLDPRVLVVDISVEGKPTVLYEPQSFLDKMPGRVKAWLRQHREWPSSAPDDASAGQTVAPHTFSVAVEWLYETIRWVKDHKPYQTMWGQTIQHRSDLKDAEGYDQDLVKQLRMAVPFYWTKLMTDLLLEMAAGLPPWVYTPVQLPERAGYVLFERPLPLPSAYPGTKKPSHLIALSWANMGDRVRLEPLVQLAGNDAPYGFPQGMIFWENDKDLEGASEVLRFMYQAQIDRHPELEDNTPNWVERNEMILRYFAAIVNFVQQKIVTTTLRPAERHVRRRIQRYVPEPPEIRVIELRARERRYLEKHDHDPEEVHWSRRWWVRKHWRPQFYPSTGQYKNILIMPFIKGPENLPTPPPPKYLYVVNR